MANFRFYLDGIEVSEPVGFDELTFNVIRSENHGIDQPFTTEVTFTGDIDKQPGLANAARILRLVFENEFINGSVEIEMVSNIYVDGLIWSFIGKIDFSTYQETNMCNGCSDGVTVSIIEDDFRERFRSRSDVDVDLLSTVDLDGNYIEALTLKQVRLHSQELYLKGNTLPNEQTDPVTFISNTIYAVFPVYWGPSDFKGQFSGTFDSQGLTFNGSAPVTNIHFVNNSNFTRTILASGRAKVDITNNNSTNSYRAYVEFALFDQDGNGVSGGAIPIITTPLIPAGNTYNVDQIFTDLAITLLPGYRFTMAVEFEVVNIGGWTFDFPPGSELTLIEFSSSDASLSSGLLVFDFLSRLILLLTGRTNALVSDYFSVNDAGCMWNNLLTTGLYIRNGQLLDEANPQTKVTWKKVFENLSFAYRGLGWEFEPDGYNGYNIRVEPIRYFYQNAVIVEFTNVAEIKRYALSDKLYNSITTGFTDKWKNQGLSGIFAIHTERNYFVNNKALNKNSSSKLDLRSDIIFEGTAIETNRRGQFVSNSSGSTDQPNDYDLFNIWLNPEEVTINPVEGTGYGLPGETGSVTFPAGTVSYGSDLIGPNSSPVDRLYNVLHTPARISAGWWQWLGQNTFGLSGIDIRLAFQSGQYYTAFEMAVPDPCNEIIDTELREDSDIDQSILNPYLGDVLVQPIGYEFEVPQELCDFLSVAAQGKKIIKFSCGSSIFAGYILKGENQPGGTGLSKFTLIGTEVPAETLGAFSSGFSNGFLI